MKFGPFVAASAIGYLPLTIVFSVFGSAAAKKSFLQLGIAAAILVLVVLGERVYSKIKRPDGTDAVDDDIPSLSADDTGQDLAQID